MIWRQTRVLALVEPVGQTVTERIKLHDFDKTCPKKNISKC
jgi:hypothetical protein